MKNKRKKKEQELLCSIAKRLGLEGIEYCKLHNELPAIKLTDEEMKLLKGGSIKDWIKRLRDAFNNGTVDITGVGN